MTLAASPPIIGVARSRTAFYINNAAVPGTATILDGTAIRTADALSDIALTSGQRVRLWPQSTAVLYRDRVVLQSGSAEVSHGPGFLVDARKLIVGGLGPASRFTVSVSGGQAVSVSATGGDAEIHNSRGVLVARMHPGEQIETQPADSTAIQITGIVEKRDDAYLLTDQTTHVTAEIRGLGLKPLTGKLVRVNGVVTSGTSAVPGATQVVAVSKITVIPAATAAGAAIPTAAASAPISTGATVAIVGGVAATATAGGLAAAGSFSASPSSVSR
jgi:hypothetical protein